MLTSENQMKTNHYLILVSCIYMLIGLVNIKLRFTQIEIIQAIWLVFLAIPLNKWLARKLGIKD